MEELNKLFSLVIKLAGKLPCWAIGHTWVYTLKLGQPVQLNKIPDHAVCTKCGISYKLKSKGDLC
jgi:hypothetical protein